MNHRPPPTPWGLWGPYLRHWIYHTWAFILKPPVNCCVKDLVLPSEHRLSWLIVSCFFSVPPCRHKCRDITSVKPLPFPFKFSQIYDSPCCLQSFLSSLRNNCCKINNKIKCFIHPSTHPMTLQIVIEFGTPKFKELHPGIILYT